MCGIAGIINLKRCDCDVKKYSRVIKAMTDIQSHRGPDGEGQLVLDEGHVFLGHRRLAILDLSDKASQPMVSDDGRYTITYNGEIYNYRELKLELQRLGVKFHSDSDTEVVLKSYEYWREESFIKFNGMFAFAIWDDYKKEMILARDRYGIKPLYYAVIGSQFVFASEYKAILEHPEFEKRINNFSIKEYFTFQNILTNNTFFENISILSSGSYLKITYKDERIEKPTVYWDYSFEEKQENISIQEYEEELDRLLCQAVKRQLVSDVDVGSYLSGGLDSGFISAIASKNIKDIKTFTCGFDLHSASGMELLYDEREQAEYMSYLFGTEHYEMVLKSGDMERCIKDLVWHLEDPKVGQSYPNYYAAKLASNFVKVVMAGTGGDELFAGYPWRYYRAEGCNSFDDYSDNYFDYWQRLLKEEQLSQILSPIYRDIKDYSTKSVFLTILQNKKLEKLNLENMVNTSLYFEAKTFLSGILLVEDKLSMAHGLESRVPFLDNDLVDFAMKLPLKYKLEKMFAANKIDENDYGKKVDKYYEINKDGKMLLRNVTGRYVPENISKGRKQGFSAPDASWFKGDSIDYVRSIVDNSNAKIYQYMNKEYVQKEVEQHFRGESNKRLLIWSILNFENWLQIFG